MPSMEFVIPPDLAKAARSLEMRFELLGVKTCKVPLAAWSVLDEAMGAVIPRWLPPLLAQFSLVGGVIEYPDLRRCYGAAFAFWSPKVYAERFANGDELLNQYVLEEGYVPLSDEEHGNLWVTKSKAGPKAEIYIWDLSAQNRVFASRNITTMLAAMAVSEQSCRDPLMWAPPV